MTGKVICKALTTRGERCKRPAAPGLTVCTAHGGGTGAARRKAKRAAVRTVAAGLWGIAPVEQDVSVEEELRQLARNKRADVIALRVELGKAPDSYHGMLPESEELADSEVGGQSFKARKRAGVHHLVGELHKAEAEYLRILQLLHEVTDGVEAVDVQRVAAQSAREAARLMRAFPGIGVDDVALQVSRRR